MFNNENCAFKYILQGFLFKIDRNNMEAAQSRDLFQSEALIDDELLLEEDSAKTC